MTSINIPIMLTKLNAITPEKNSVTIITGNIIRSVRQQVLTIYSFILNLYVTYIPCPTIIYKALNNANMPINIVSTHHPALAPPFKAVSLSMIISEQAKPVANAPSQANESINLYQLFLIPLKKCLNNLTLVCQSILRLCFR